ncbi:hypothetical protein PP494_gp51 [Gordonia phage Matteo]|uniref:Uncharacterized protein n=1 Tax=Gordonia phage Matteo TaxID=2759392 RepID=A0A7L7SIA2_9CAUD|nr:hypothetical protein PP494_gp51 [Gordonia phage Matteo]QOC55981.1 hypothetical protein SEA_MATTEO_51 [Gordonia phage Matteo]
MSDDVRAAARRDLESDRAFLDGTSPFDAPGAGYRLNTWVRTRIPALLAELEPAPCDMKQGAPYDFAWCETHDTTFALGEKCKFDGREPWEVFADEANEQRQLKVRAEMTLDRTRGDLDAALATIQRARAQTEIPCTPIDTADVARKVGWDQAMAAVARILGGES